MKRSIVYSLLGSLTFVWFSCSKPLDEQPKALRLGNGQPYQTNVKKKHNSKRTENGISYGLETFNNYSGTLWQIYVPLDASCDCFRRRVRVTASNQTEEQKLVRFGIGYAIDQTISGPFIIESVNYSDGLVQRQNPSSIDWIPGSIRNGGASVRYMAPGEQAVIEFTIRTNRPPEDVEAVWSVKMIFPTQVDPIENRIPYENDYANFVIAY